MNTLPISSLFYVFETIGIIAFALSGLVLARQKGFDSVGIYIIALFTAFGGGTLRDVILDIQPVYWISHSEYPLVLLFLVISLSLFKHPNIHSRWLFIPDTIGMALFSITAAQTAHNAGLPLIIIAILSTVVAAFGGVLRDILCQEVPMIFKKNSTLYATIAFAGACLYVFLIEYIFWEPSYCMFIAATATFIMRFLAHYFNIKLQF